MQQRYAITESQISSLPNSLAPREDCPAPMNQRMITTLLMLLCLAGPSTFTVRPHGDKSVTAAQVNGTWKTKGGEFKIWALGNQRLQVESSGVYEFKAEGPNGQRGRR